MNNLNSASSNIASGCPSRLRQKPYANGRDLLSVKAFSNGDYNIAIMSRGVQVQQFSFWQWEQNLTEEDMHHEVMMGLTEWCIENKVTFTKDGLNDLSFILNKIAQAKSKIQH
jgi:hypothetical protein